MILNINFHFLNAPEFYFSCQLSALVQRNIIAGDFKCFVVVCFLGAHLDTCVSLHVQLQLLVIEKKRGETKFMETCQDSENADDT